MAVADSPDMKHIELQNKEKDFFFLNKKKPFLLFETKQLLDDYVEKTSF